MNLPIIIGGILIVNISLASYTIRVKDGIRGRYMPLGNFDTNGNDFIDFFREYLEHRENEFFLDSKLQRMMKCRNVTNFERKLNGIIEDGPYGSESILRNIDTKDVSYEKLSDDADMNPFYFIIDIPEHFDEAIILLQRFKGLGCKNTFEKDIFDYFNSKFPHLELEMNRLIPKQFIKDQLVNNRIVKLRFIKYNIPSDISDIISNRGHIEEESHMELMLIAGQKQRLPLISNIVRFIDNEIDDLSEIVEIPYFDIDNVKVEVDINGSIKTLDISNLKKIMPYFDVTNEVEILDNGHPSFESIDTVARSLLQDLSEAIPREG